MENAEVYSEDKKFPVSENEAKKRFPLMAVITVHSRPPDLLN